MCDRQIGRGVISSRLTAPAGFLSFYLRDELSALAVRGVTLPGNNKSDPNLETGTYGLFSICCQSMRAGIVDTLSGFRKDPTIADQAHSSRRRASMMLSWDVLIPCARFLQK